MEGKWIVDYNWGVVDLLTVAEELRREDAFYKVGGAEYLAGLLNYVVKEKNS